MNAPLSPTLPDRPEPSMAPWVSVVIVNYNAWPDVGRLVATLAAAPEVAVGWVEIVVVDNASQGPVPAAFRPPGPGAGIRLVDRATNDGFAAGVNAGWRAARGRWLLVLNPDIVVAADWLARVLARVAQIDSEAALAPGIVGFALRNPDGSPQGSVGAFPSLSRTLWEQLIPRPRRKYQADRRTRAGAVSWVTGACMLVNSRLLSVLGGMDEDFFLYYEEVALCRSARRAGWRVEYDPTVVATHLRPLQNRALSPKMRVITRHSKLLYFSKHLPRWQFLGLSWMITLEAAVRGAWSGLQGEAEEQRAWRTIGAVARGFRAGRTIRGRAIHTLAAAVEAPERTGTTQPGRAKPRRVPQPGRGNMPGPAGIGSARKQRGARKR